MDAETLSGAGHARRWLTLLVLCFSLFIIILDNTVLNVAIPTLARELDADTSELQWMVDSYVLVFAGLLLTAGSLGDRFGRKGALNLGLLIFGLGSGLSAFAGSAGELIATRALMGVGAAFIMPTTLSILTNVFRDPRERGRAIGVWAGVAGIGGAIGPLASGWLLEHFWWGSVFAINLPIVAFAIIAGARVLVPTSKDPAAPRLDLVGAALSVAGLVSLVYGIIEAPDRGWTDAQVLFLFALAGVVLALFGVWERRSDHPMLNLDFFRNRRFTAASAAITLTFFSFFGSLFFLTQYLQFVMGYTALEAGIRMLPFAAVTMVLAPTSPRIVERFGTKAVVAAGLTIASVGLGLMTLTTTESGYGTVLLSMVVLAFGFALIMAPATESIMGALPRDKAGVGSAVNDTTRQVGGALGVAVLGSVLASGYGSKIGDALVGSPVPPGAADLARRSLGAAIRIPGLAATAKDTFVDAMHVSVMVATAVLLLGAFIVLRFLPARAHEDTAQPEALSVGLGRDPVGV